jgi:DNA-binding NarL/FixJ family response regulator
MAKRSTSTSRGEATPNPSKSRVLIVDDHALLRDGMRLMINNEPDLLVCGEAASEAEALRSFNDAKPDLVVVDITLESGSGIDLIKRIVNHDPEARIVVLSMHDDRIYGERALRAGAKGFVSKHEPGDAILTAIRRILSGEMYFSDRLTQQLLRRAAETGSAAATSPIDLLTDRELEAFEHIGHGLTSQEIAARMHIRPKTVDRYRENVKKKLNITTSNELIHQATLWVQQN